MYLPDWSPKRSPERGQYETELFLLILFAAMVSATVWTVDKLNLHDNDPQGFEDFLSRTLGLSSTREGDGPSVVGKFKITYWNGKEVTFWVPEDVWSASVVAGNEHGCDPWLVVATAFSESPQYNNSTPSDVGALGVWQFMLSTWLGLWESNPPPRTHIPSAADAACRYLTQIGAVDALDEGEERFVDAFAITPPVWNRHIHQARFVYKLTKELNERDKGTEQPPLLLGLVEMKWWSPIVIWYLDFLGILPDFGDAEGDPVDIPDVGNPGEFRMPYDSYVVTQGPHGQSYGHLAVDISAGKGATIKSPISGVVTAKFTDGLKNTVLVIENQRYRVTLMHGDYSVDRGDELTISDGVGSESNNGNTRDKNGNYCGTGSNCGYHTHLNVYDKEAGHNVYPLNLL